MANYYYQGILESEPIEFSKKIASDIFFEYIPENVVPEKCLDGYHTFFYLAEEADISVEEAKEFFIYSPSKGLLYKFLID